MKLEYPATHTFPDWLNFLRLDRAHGFDAVQMGPECGGNGSRFPCRESANLSSKLTTLSCRGKAAGRQGLLLSQPCTWQTAGKTVIDEPRPEDGTDFSSYAAGALPHFLKRDCRGVVVAGHAD